MNDQPVNIYLLTNKANGKRFVGITAKNMASRRANYLRQIQHGETNPLITDIAIVGLDNIALQILEKTPRHQAKIRRAFYVNYFSTLEPDGYNQPFEA